MAYENSCPDFGPDVRHRLVTQEWSSDTVPVVMGCLSPVASGRTVFIDCSPAFRKHASAGERHAAHEEFGAANSEA